MEMPGTGGNAPTLVVSHLFYSTLQKHFLSQLTDSLRSFPEVHLLIDPQGFLVGLGASAFPNQSQWLSEWLAVFPGLGSQSAHQRPEAQAIHLLPFLSGVKASSLLPVLGDLGILLLSPSQM